MGDNVLIGGFIAGPDTVVVARAIGPSLGVSGSTAPYQIRRSSCTTEMERSSLRTTHWKESQEAEIKATGLAPSDDHESAIVRTLATGGYTAIVRGKDDTTGVGLMEVYNLQ